MHFGQKINLKNGLLFAFVSVFFACKNEVKYSSFSNPTAGMVLPIGKEFKTNLMVQTDKKIDSIVYLIDTTKVTMRKDTNSVNMATKDLKVGNHLLSAKIYSEGAFEDVTTNFVLVATQAPISYGYKIKNSFPHDEQSYVEGIEFHDGFIYESAGQYGESSIRKVNLNSGKVLQQTKIDKAYFAEGMTLVGDKIVQLTYKEKIGFVYDKATLKQIATFPYMGSAEGWGLYFDGEKILNTDGSNTIFYLDKNNYQRIGQLDVFDHKAAVMNLNEIEMVEGKIYANVYQLEGEYANHILIINPKTGVLEATINLTGLNPMKGKENDADYILNGIAYDKQNKRLFVTGKKWSKIFEIELVKGLK
ncbi:MAG: glutaminyl-peptide cyclotransferase [Sphingobacteriaceae bacterium]|nr:glutaminyl-peptide cyclotransferase [Sphingobacteriaceae bacterium]